MSHRFATVLGLEVHYKEWGVRNENEPSVVCWHGLLRTCGDFDTLARHLSESCGYHVICPDTIGRGLSEWSSKPKEEYHVYFYAALARGLLEMLGITSVFWFGTSMGGMIGYMGGAQEHLLKPYIKKLILNDIGPHLEDKAIQRILSYASKLPVVETFQALEEGVAKTYQSFGIHDAALLRSIVEGGMRRAADGGHWTRDYDVNVVDALRVGSYSGSEECTDPWALYDAISCPVLTIRGSTSDLLSEETFQEMQVRGPRSKGVVVQDVGHAPFMNTEDQIELVVSFFGARSL
ncbi:Hypothetical protein, putative [Bodo saltans]|uniref:AB hydrolase-1 domain-containing protein n=1 Tax=Bodo saltans TaxID=75058 RepID=A0A0S4J383_BODSA|nr:Hypothetical protein, putative [Bodo saltans]|eukprot:CUG66222.1 Hypothetical protein, putative [Bodo saltans]